MLEGKKAKEAVSILIKTYPNAKYYLNFNGALQLLVAAIMSAQTHDNVVNELTPNLFSRFNSVDDFANADVDELVKYISRVSFAGAKAKNIIKACSMIKSEHNGKVPDSMDELVALPGIGRKTANTILINAFGKVEGIPVDTWVIKLSGRIGLSKSNDPEEIEQDLEKVVERKAWGKVAYVLKNHGHEICKTQTPLCSKCVLNGICERNGVTKSG